MKLASNIKEICCISSGFSKNSCSQAHAAFFATFRRPSRIIFYKGHHEIETRGLQGSVPYHLLTKCCYFDYLSRSKVSLISNTLCMSVHPSVLDQLFFSQEFQFDKRRRPSEDSRSPSYTSRASGKIVQCIGVGMRRFWH